MPHTSLPLKFTWVLPMVCHSLPANQLESSVIANLGKSFEMHQFLLSFKIFGISCSWTLFPRTNSCLDLHSGKTHLKPPVWSKLTENYILLDYTPNANMASNLNCHCSGLTASSSCGNTKGLLHAWEACESRTMPTQIGCHISIQCMSFYVMLYVKWQ